MDRISAGAALAIATGIVVYAVYFDYKRRNDVDFRKKLSKSFILFAILSNGSLTHRKGQKTRQTGSSWKG